MHYILALDNTAIGEPKQLPIKMPLGWIGRNATETELAERCYYPCTVETTADPEEAGAEYNGDGTYTYKRYVKPEPTLEEKLAPYMPIIDAFLTAWGKMGIGTIPETWLEAVQLCRAHNVSADDALEMDVLWRQLLPVEYDLREWLAMQGGG